MADLRVEVEEINSVTQKLSVNVPWREVKKEIDKSFSNISKTAKVKGFRQGKIPRSVLELMYRQEVEKEVINYLLNFHYFDIIRKKGINVVAEPKIEQQGIKEGEDFSFVATVEVEPSVEPKDYLGMTLTKPDETVTDEDVNNTIQKLRQSFASLKEAEAGHKIVNGDMVTLKYEGIVDGKVIDSLKSDGSTIQVSEKSALPGLTEQLVGMEKGETKEIKLTLPENFYQEELRSKEAAFKIEIMNVQQPILPEINEEFIKNFQKYSSLSELEDDIRASLAEEKKVMGRNALRQEIADKLLAANEFEVPPSVVERETLYLMREQINNMVVRGRQERERAIEQVTKHYSDFKSAATKRTKLMYIMKAIAHKESINVSDTELDNYINDMAKLSNESFSACKEKLEKEGLIDIIKSQISEDKVFKYIEDNSIIYTNQPGE